MSGSSNASSAGRVAVLGAGAWGTALAIQLARVGTPCDLWGRDAHAMQRLQAERRNDRFLPGIVFPTQLGLGDSLNETVALADTLLIAVPSHAFPEMLQAIKPLLTPKHTVAWATKGFELASGRLPHELARTILGDAIPLAVLSGPTFALEVAKGLPCAITAASTELQFATALAVALSGDHFRAYTSTDVIGVEVGGALKNVIAIGAGIADGLELGANARLALITRGLAEITRLGVALGAKPDTFMGLSGLGDLVLTCTDNQSRNRRLGLLIAKGSDTQAAVKAIGSVVEGIPAARAARDVATRAQVDMPIVLQIYRVLYEHMDVATAVKALLDRQLKPER